MANKIVTELVANSRGFKSGLKTAEKDADAFTKKLAKMFAGVFSIRILSGWIQKTIDWGSATSDLAVAIGLTSEQMQVLEYALRKTGGSVDDIMVGFRRLSQARVEALSYEGSKQLRVFEHAFGITREELVNLNNIKDLFDRVADVFHKKDFGAAAPGLAMEVLGRAGQKLMPLFIEGLKEGEAEARSLGFIVSNEVVAELDRFKDIQEQIIQQMRGPFASMLVYLGNLIAKWVATLKWIPTYIVKFGEAFENISATENAKNATGRTQQQYNEEYVSYIKGKRKTLPKREDFNVSVMTIYEQVIAAYEEAIELTGEAMARDIQEEVDAPAVDKMLRDIDEEALKRLSEASRKKGRLTEKSLSAISFDSLAKIGGFTGRGNVRQENTLRDMEGHMRRLERAANVSGIKVKDL